MPGFYLQFGSEDELSLALCGSNYLKSMFTKVYRIAEKTIEPDIDIIQIDDDSKIVWGYEVKLLRLVKGTIRRYEFYAGLGETILLARHGVMQAILVMGFPRNAEDDAILVFVKWIKEMKKYLEGVLPD